MGFLYGLSLAVKASKISAMASQVSLIEQAIVHLTDHLDILFHRVFHGDWMQIPILWQDDRAMEALQ